MSKRKPVFKDPIVGTTVGLVLLGAAWYILYDAWEGRGRRTPLPLRPAVPF